MTAVAPVPNQPALHGRTPQNQSSFNDDSPRINHPVDDAPDPAQAEEDEAAVHEAHTLASLRQLLDDTAADDLPAVQACFEELAFHRDTVAGAAQRDPPTAGLGGLGARLQAFLEQFDRQVIAGVVDLKIAGPTVAAAICNGLGILPAILDASVLSKAAEKALGKTVTHLTCVLTVVVTGAPAEPDRQHVDDMLAMLTWLSRGLKAGLLASDDRAVRDAFDAALDAMPAWTAAPGSRSMDSYRLASCFVQVNTVRQFALLYLDGEGQTAQANRRRLQGVLRSLCVAFPEIFGQAGVNGVQVTNVGNTIKDFVDDGLLPGQTHAWLIPVIKVLLQCMPRVPQREMLRRGGQTLANCSNFLRMLSESELVLESGFSVCTAPFQAACAHLLALLAQDRFVLRGRVGQSLANLMSFVKAMALLDERQHAVSQDRMKAKVLPDGRQQAASRNRLKAAVRNLMRLLMAQDLQRLSPMSISGTLLALCTFWGRGIAPAAACRTLTRGLIAAIPSCAGQRWESVTVALSLRAIVQLHELDRSAQPGVQAAFQRLLQLLAKKPVQDEAQRLYCLKALRLGLHEQWTTLEEAVLQAALCRLLRWNGSSRPGIAQLDAAIAGLHRGEDATPDRPVLPEEAEATTPAQLQAATVERLPPGGKLAAGAASFPGQHMAEGKASTTYRASAATTTAAVGMTTSTTANTGAFRPQAKAASGLAGRNEMSGRASPLSQWFTLASGPERGAVLTDGMAHLASSGQHAGLVNCTDEYGDSALYYAVVNGKPELVQWLLGHAEFSLDMSAETAREFVARLEVEILSSANWQGAKQALAMVIEAIDALSGAEQEDSGHAQRASKVASPASKASHAVSSSAPIYGTGKKAQARKPGSGQAHSTRTPAVSFETDPQKRREQWFQLARGKNGSKQVLREMRRLDEIDPDLFHSFDESGEDALHYAEGPGKEKIRAWLSELGARRAMNAGFELRNQYVEAGGLAGMIDKSRGHPSFGNDQRTTAEIMADVSAFEQTLKKFHADDSSRPPTDEVKCAQACMQDDVASLRRLLRTEGGKNWASTSVALEGHNQLMAAAFGGNARMVEALLEVDQGRLAGQVSARGYTALLIAALAGHLDVLKILLKFEHGRLALQQTPEGWNALMVAAGRGNHPCVKYLLSWNGGKLAQSLSVKRENALFLAAMNGHVDVAQTLLNYQNGVLASHVGSGNCTAMDMAARHGHAPVVKLLLEWRDGTLALLGQGEFTPLLLAAQEGHVAVLKVLLESEDGPLLAKCCLQDGRNALALAEQHGQAAAAQFLRAFEGGSLFGNASPMPPDETQPGS
jgi:ankyrin repeat protein